MPPRTLSEVSEIEGVDGLFTVDLAGFTAARTVLVRDLKAAGRKGEAAEVGQLRRPPATAWALNQVAREEPELVAAALDAGAELRAATEAAMEGDASALRSATATERAASGAVVQAAERRLSSATSGNRPKLSATVHAAVLDDEVAEQLRRGILSADHDRSGLGLGFDGAAASSPRTAPPDELAARRARAEREAAEEQARLEVAAEVQRQAGEEARRARRAELERDARRARKDAARLEVAAHRKEAAAAEARDAAGEADGAAAAAERALADFDAEGPEGPSEPG